MIDSLEHATDSLGELAAQLKKTVARVDRKRSHKLRNVLAIAGGTAALATAALATRRLLRKGRSNVDAEVGVPVATDPADVARVNADGARQYATTP